MSAAEEKVAHGAGAAEAEDVPAAHQEDLTKPPETIHMTDEEELHAATSKDESDSSKLKTLLGVLKRMIGVKDMAAMRLSLPANLLEPVPNLEYWTYIDRGDLFCTVGDFEDPLDRMLAVLRFALTKELKFVHGGVCKPYNSVLGEHFRCHWDVEPPILDADGNLVPKQGLRSDAPLPMSTATAATPEGGSRKSTFRRSEKASESGSTAEVENGGNPPTTPRSGGKVAVASSSASTSGEDEVEQGKKGKRGFSKLLGTRNKGGAEAEQDGAGDAATQSTSSVTAPNGAGAGADKRRITFITEQVSHHPPISSFFVECKEAGVTLAGVDQLSAKYTGTSVKVMSGPQNKGIFLSLTEQAKFGHGEQYQITHPVASVNGILRGSLWAAISDKTDIICRGPNGKRLRALIEYKEESWLLKARFALEGVIWESDDEDLEQVYNKARDVPQDKVVAMFEGSWKSKTMWKRKGDKDWRLLINVEDLDPIAKEVRPLASQEEYESRRMWDSVTNAILSKEFGLATKHKQEIEQRQRVLAAERKRKGEEFVPTYFDPDISSGVPRLTAAGRAALDGELKLAGYQ